MLAVDDCVVLAVFNTNVCFKNMISMHLFYKFDIAFVVYK